MYWSLLVIALCTLLLLFTIRKEIRRPNKLWLAARIAATAFALISLALIALPITIHQKQKKRDLTPVILLTEGYNKDTVQKMLTADKDVKIFTADKDINDKNDFNATYITEATFFAERYPTADTVHILGYGLTKSDLGLLKNTPVIFHPADIKNSIIAIDWTKKLTPGEPLLVQGKFTNASSSTAKIVLTGFDVQLDSFIIAANQTAYFQLSSTPKHVDKAVYSVTVLSGKDTLETQLIPVEVKAVKPPGILLLGASPDFENKFLKNWLTDNGYKFAVKTAVSKDRYNNQFVNMSPAPLEHITASLLEKFDVIIADATALAALPASYISMIRRHVESEGLGLIIKTDGAQGQSAFYSKPFPVVKSKDSIQHAVKLTFIDTSYSTAPLKIEQPMYISNVPGTQPLVKDQQKRIVVSSKMFGLGKVIFITIPNTYTWQLSGNKNDYSSYWSGILQRAAKKDTLQHVWNTAPALPQINEEVQLKLQTAEEHIPQIQTGKDFVYMAQNHQLPYEWNGSYWPTRAGWQPLIDNKGLPEWWYVFDNKSWKGIRAFTKISATKKYADEQVNQPHEVAVERAAIIEFPKIYFFLIFMACSGFLWFEAKRNARFNTYI